MVDTEEAELSREAPSLAARDAADEVMVRGCELVLEDDVVRPTTGGVSVLGVPGADVLGVAGLDQESKKSSSVCSAGVAGEAEVSIPSTKIPCGYLQHCVRRAFVEDLRGLDRTLLHLP